MKNEPKIKKVITASKVKETVLDNLIWIAGCALFAAGISIFAVPNDIAQSGITGLAIIVNHLIHTPVGLTNFVLNIPLIILAWIFLGWKFVGKTLWVTVVLSALLDVTGHLPPYTGDKLLSSLFCGAITGAGLAVVFMRGATTGGTDILAILFRKK